MKHFVLIFLCCIRIIAFGQNDRITDHNNINWLQSFITIRLNKNFDGQADVQWRRTKGVSEPQQLLLRSGIQYRYNNQVAFGLGYAWVETYPYGDYPIAANGTFPERRLHQQVVVKSALSKLSTNQRLRIEQRWLGRIDPQAPGKVAEWVFSNRFRYLLRLQRPFADSANGRLYAAVANEVFINAGKNVGVNVFDQNRLQLIIGAKLTKHLSVEGGYLKQTVQQGRRTTSNNTVFQNNDGATLALLLQL